MGILKTIMFELDLEANLLLVYQMKNKWRIQESDIYSRHNGYGWNIYQQDGGIGACWSSI